MSYIQLSSGITGEVLYAVFYSSESGWIWDNTNSRWRDTTAASGSGNGGLDYGTNWPDVAVQMTEDQGSGGDPTGHYQLQVPSALESIVELVDVVIHRRATNPAAVSDAPIAAGTHSVGTGTYLITKTG